jgi:hypothetical protein
MDEIDQRDQIDEMDETEQMDQFMIGRSPEGQPRESFP